MPSATQIWLSPSIATPLGREKYPGPSPALPKVRDKFAVGVEDLDAVVQRIADVKIAVRIHRHPRWLGKIAGRGEFVVVSGGADLAYQFERIRVIHQNLIERDVGNVEQAVLVIDGQHARARHALGDYIFRFVGGIEHQHVTQAGIGNEETIAVVHGQADDAHEMGMRLVLDHVHVAGFGVENEDRADLLVGDIQVALGIDRHAVGLGELPQNFAAFCLGVCVPARRSIHFAFLVLFPASTCEIFSAA